MMQGRAASVVRRGGDHAQRPRGPTIGGLSCSLATNFSTASYPASQLAPKSASMVIDFLSRSHTGGNLDDCERHTIVQIHSVLRSRLCHGDRLWPQEAWVG